MIGRRISVAMRRTDSASAGDCNREPGFDDVYAKQIELTGQ
jgi:hypothetical protein